MFVRLCEILARTPFLGGGGGPLGVDIGTRAVKLLRWPRKSGRPPEYAITPLPAGAVEERNIRDAEAVGRCIAEAAGTLRSPGRLAVTAVPSSLVMQKTLAMEPEMSDAELEAQITVEADRYIPWPIDEVRMDICRLDGPEHAAGSILLSVCRKEHVDSRERAIESAGLRAAAVDAEHHAFERVWRLLAPAPDEAKLTAVADIGAGAIRLYVLSDGRSIYNAERPFSDSAQSRREPESFAVDSAGQLGQALQLFHSSSRHGRVASLYLCGAAAAAEGLAEQAQRILAIPVASANPFSGASAGPVAKDAPALLLAAGLAIAGARHD
ncbi:MAG: type IV pilus assembly protein PilM [Gammaproteobacteria bacterium]|nr:type IV pilus assembly protein PilM [Gammaproteobacteria bacterium]MYH47241.1 type IV pilus assembly protein PilM [Gammaproteobacteria bacterium]MYL12867.1 type IV pilus assembly protein PilM [Gammaproteobacteria bacterium]